MRCEIKSQTTPRRRYGRIGIALKSTCASLLLVANWRTLSSRSFSKRTFLSCRPSLLGSHRRCGSRSSRSSHYVGYKRSKTDKQFPVPVKPPYNNLLLGAIASLFGQKSIALPSTFQKSRKTGKEKAKEKSSQSSGN